MSRFVKKITKSFCMTVPVVVFGFLPIKSYCEEISEIFIGIMHNALCIVCINAKSCKKHFLEFFAHNLFS
jgi:hypothetical protein